MSQDPANDAGGSDGVCWLDRVCVECGGLDEHRADCPFAATTKGTHGEG